MAGTVILRWLSAWKSTELTTKACYLLNPRNSPEMVHRNWSIRRRLRRIKKERILIMIARAVVVWFYSTPPTSFYLPMYECIVCIEFNMYRKWKSITSRWFGSMPFNFLCLRNLYETRKNLLNSFLIAFPVHKEKRTYLPLLLVTGH